MRRAAIAWLVACGALVIDAQAATFTFRSLDSAGEGLNDARAFTPIGGNTAATLGAARMNVLVEAGRIWGALLLSEVAIVVDAEFNALTCSSNSGTLGQAGPRSTFVNFAGAPAANVFYVAALADSLAGRNLSSQPTSADIGATFNSAVDSDAGCLGGRGFYYGLDHNRGNRIDFLVVVLHELAHGLGFASEIDPTTGVAFFSPSSTGAERFGSYVHQVFDESLGRSWPQLTTAERLASAVRTGSLAWSGANANRQLSRFSSGGTANGRLRLNAPATVSAGSSVSHWDPILLPSALMEPNLPSSVAIGSVDITACALQDIGWRITRCPDDAVPNVAPVAVAQSVTVAEDANLVITLAGTDANNDPLSFAIAAVPASGGLSSISASRSVTYTPRPNFNGSDTFLFTVNDGAEASSPATVSITVTPVNDAPTAVGFSVNALSGQTTSVALGGADVDGDVVSYSIVANPLSGTLSGAAPNLSYRSNDGFVGADSFTYRVSDGTLNSAIATVAINVSSPSSVSASTTPAEESGGGALGDAWLPGLLALAALRRWRIAAHQK